MRVATMLLVAFLSAIAGCSGAAVSDEQEHADGGADSAKSDAAAVDSEARDAVTSDTATSDTATSDTATSDTATSDTATSDTATPSGGGDRDGHGCIGSAGYQWCAKEMKCVRPWDLAMEKGFPNTAEAFAAYCGS